MGGVLASACLAGEGRPQVASRSALERWAFRGALTEFELPHAVVWAWRWEHEPDPLVRDGGLVVAVHGQVLRSESPGSAGDILLLYRRGGVEALRTVDGELSFLIWDDDRRTLVLGRDPFGTRPLFICSTGDLVAAGTEIGQLQAIGFGTRTPDALRIRGDLGLVDLDPRRTQYEGVRRALPGQTYVFGGSEGVAVTPAWTPPQRLDWGLTPAKAERGLQLAIHGAISRRRWQRPVIALSGGLDSTAIAGTIWNDPQLEASVSGPDGLQALTLTFGRWYGDETERARSVAGSFGRRLLEIDVSQMSVIAGARELSEVTQQPVPGETGYQLPPIVAGLHSLCGQTAVLGLGGDDFFGGSALGGVDLLLRGRLNSAIHQSLAEGRHRGLGIAQSVLQLLLRPAVSTVVRKGILGRVLHRTPTRRSRVSELFSDWECGSVAWTARFLRMASIACSPAYDFIEHVFARGGLVPAYPLFDRSLATFVGGIPMHILLPGGLHKGLLRGAMAGLLPAAVLEAGKTNMDELVDEELRSNLGAELGEAATWKLNRFSAPQAIPLASLPSQAGQPPLPTWESVAAELWLRSECLMSE